MTTTPQNISCGIDFGTSNSTCAIARDGKVTLVPLEGDSLTLPSAIFFCENGRVLFGREATLSYIEGEDGRLMRGLKSVLGTELMGERTIIKGQARSFVEILSLYIKHLKDKAEATVGGAIMDVVFGRPVHFHDSNPTADQESQGTLEEIAQSIGFKNIRFQYEPIAAAFAHEQNIADEKLSLVIDIGGGTSDFTVIKVSRQRSHTANRASDILGTSGIRLGGTNFDQRLSMQVFMPYLGLGTQYRSDFNHDKLLQVPTATYTSLSDWSKVNSVQTDKAIRETQRILRQAIEPPKLERLRHVQEHKLGHALLQEVEQAKIALTSHPEVRSDLAKLGLEFGVTIKAQEFDRIVMEYIHKITASMHECIKRAGVSLQDIELVILTGGSSELPIINRLVREYCPAATISKDNKFGSVGLGLAYNSRTVFKVH